MDPSFHPVAILWTELVLVVVTQRTSLLFRALPRPPDNSSRWDILREGSLVRRLNPITWDPEVERRVDWDDLEDEVLVRNARGDVVDVEVVGADVVSEKASAHS